MALLTTYGASNRVIINDKTVTYSKRRIYGGGWSYVSGTVVVTLGSVWEYHRYCVKTYMYVGMDRTTA